MFRRMSRRAWLQIAGGSLVAGGAGAACYRARQRTIRLGLLGAGIRGGELANTVKETGWFPIKGQLVAVCDADRSRADRLRSQYAPSAAVTDDFRRVLARDDIEAVLVATPDHWHAAMETEALRAGKHVYAEKPLALTIAEGQHLVEAVQASDRVFLVGTWQRSDRLFQLACTLVRNGRLGKLRRISITIPGNLAGGPFANRPVPPSLDWQKWLGPAPSAEYCPERFAHFRQWFEYAGGTMTDWGAHHVDIAHWAMDIKDSGPQEISAQATLPRIANGYNTPAQFQVDMKYPNGVLVNVCSSATEASLVFEGDEGRLRVNRKRITGTPVDELARSPLPPGAVWVGHRYRSWVDRELTHLRHFLDCIVTGEPPISDVVSQHRTATACHLANIAMRLERSVKWDPRKEAFIDDAQAAKMVGRQSRAI